MDELKTQRVNDRLTIYVGERFDYQMHKAFREAYVGIKEGGLNYIVDLSKTRHMDSSALGMILLLKEHAEHNGGQISIKSPSDAVRKILQIANFDSIIKIEN